MHSRATDRKSASKCQGKWPDQTLDQAFGSPEVLVAVSTSRLSCKRARKTRTLMPVWDSYGESRLIPLLAECVLPVLVLRIAWEEKLLLANLEKQNYAGVVHFLIKRAHDLEQLLATYRACMMDQPARVDAM